MKENYIIAGFQKTAEQHFPDQKSALNAKLNKRLQELRIENSDATEEKQFHLERQILPGIAAYEVLQTVVPKEEAFRMVHGYVEEHAKSARKKIMKLIHIPGLYRLIPNIFAKGMRKMFNERAGFAATEYQTSGGVWRIDMTRCPYHDTGVQYGCSELCRCFCDSDDITYDDMHPKLLWHRTKTLGRGDDCCDFSIKVVKQKIKQKKFRE